MGNTLQKLQLTSGWAWKMGCHYWYLEKLHLEKTTTLNAILPFIDHNVKIYSAEDTPEVKLDIDCGKRLVTRDSGANEDSRVEMFDLLKAALRESAKIHHYWRNSRRRGSDCFQAMQTGHLSLPTFHASSIVKMIQRFTGDPINVPMRFFDNLNFAIFQEVVEAPGGGIARRITGIDEVIGYNKEADGVLTRGMFDWNPVRDKHYFRGMFQSHLMENKMAALMGFENKRDIYDEMARRTEALQRMADNDLVHYDDVFDILDVYYQLGWEAFSKPSMFGRRLAMIEVKKWSVFPFPNFSKAIGDAHTQVSDKFRITGNNRRFCSIFDPVYDA